MLFETLAAGCLLSSEGLWDGLQTPSRTRQVATYFTSRLPYYDI